jgi:hypothetical protein
MSQNALPAEPILQQFSLSVTTQTLLSSNKLFHISAVKNTVASMGKTPPCTLLQRPIFTQ